MANDKMDEKEKQTDDVSCSAAGGQPLSAPPPSSTPVMKLMNDMLTSSHMPRESRATTSISYVQDSTSDESGIATHSDSSGNISIAVPPPSSATVPSSRVAPNNTPAMPVRSQVSVTAQTLHIPVWVRLWYYSSDTRVTIDASS